jgi:hypothetical protein
MREAIPSIAVVVWLLLAAGGCQTAHVYTDVTGDPRFNPGGIVGRCFFLREGAYLLKPQNQRPRDQYARLVAPDGRIYPLMSTFESGDWQRPRLASEKQIIAVVPAGTMVCVRKIVRDDSRDDKPLEPVAVINDNRFMSQVLLSPMLVQGPDPLAQWTADERYLVPREHAVPAATQTNGIRTPANR